MKALLLLVFLCCIFAFLSNTHVKGLVCLRCSDVTEPRLCDRVEYCNPGEVCGVQMYRADNGDVGYWTGCMPQSDCATLDNRTSVIRRRSMFIDGEVTCRDCCVNNLCNSHGCGSPKYPSTRGPLCFSCKDVRDPTYCHKIVPCNVNEKCFIQQRTVFGQTYYTSKCEVPSACNIHLSGPGIVGKRDIFSPCLHCCDGDLCNSNCSTASSIVPTTSSSPPYVAFYVTLSRDHGTGVIVFDKVTTNIGNRYDNTTGVFTAASNGTYVFSWSIETQGGLTDSVLEVNGIDRGYVKADETSSYYDTSTSFAVLELKSGDKVHIRVKTGRSLATHTMFSGWMYNSSDQRAAFYASIINNDRSTYNFDKVITNQGNVYSSATGMFRAPRMGIYVITSAVTSISGAYGLYFNVKGSDTFNIYVDAGSSRYDNVGGMSIAYLYAGDQVHVHGSGEIKQGSMFAGFMAVSGHPSGYPGFIALRQSSTRSSPVKFDKTYTPTNGYSTSTGIFTADRSGVYVFLWNIEASGQKVETELRVNSIGKGRTRSDARRTGYDDSSSVAVLQLSAGDNVSVYITSGTVDGGQSIFCGWLLYDL